MEYTRSGGRRPGKIDDMQQVCQQWTEDRNGKPVIAGSLFNRFILRRLSIYVTWIFVALGIRAHTATLLMTLAGLAGIVLCIPHAIHMTVLGGLSYMLFDLLDAVDGEIARWNNSSSTKGLYLDQVSHVLIEPPSLGVPALHYYLLTQDDLYLVLAAMAVLSSVMGRTFREMLFRINAEVVDQPEVTGPTESDAKEKSSGFFLKSCNYLRAMPLTSVSNRQSQARSYDDRCRDPVVLCWLGTLTRLHFLVLRSLLYDPVTRLRSRITIGIAWSTHGIRNRQAIKNGPI